MAVYHWFLPHPETHKKAHLISWHGLVIYLLIFILLQVSFSLVGYWKPGVLGVNSNIDQKVLIELTNKERAKIGLPPLTENSALDKAAANKAANMFTENYWAHFAPSGKSPWDFILGSGYKFSYAGENLAKNFYNSEDVVAAWMNSPTHKENIVSPKYQEIGMAVVEGNLNGQKTTLVVQMFGNTSNTLAATPAIETPDSTQLAEGKDYQVPVLTAEVKSEKSTSAVVDSYQIYKVIGVAVFSLIGILLIIDFIILRRRGVFRSTSHHFANLSFMAAGVITIINTSPGNIL